MDPREVGRYWERNAAAWTKLSRAGYDVYRDLVNTPAFLVMLPYVAGLRGLDLGCGEGTNTRQVAELGAAMTAVDVAPSFVAAARDWERASPRGVTYLHASADRLPFAGASFDFATAFMSLMDIPDLHGVLAETARVLRPGGFLQCSIEHPLNTMTHREWVRDDDGRKQALAVAGYFEQRETIETWLFSSVPDEQREAFEPFRVPRFRRTLSEWLTAVAGAGFAVEAAAEPYADDATVREYPRLVSSRIVPFFLHLRCRRPACTLPAEVSSPGLTYAPEE